MASDEFSVENEKLFYKGQPVGEDAAHPGFNQFSFEKTALGGGGNGVTFRVQHRTLEVDQVVKLYFPDKEGVADKARLEARKNADPRVRDVIAQVHDAGTYLYPEEISYSVMESVSEIQTLKEWLAERDAQWSFAKLAAVILPNYKEKDVPLWKSRRNRHVMAEALSVAAGFIGAVARLHAAGVIHGDLNPGNILILQASADPIWSSWDLQEFNRLGLKISDPKYNDFHSAHNRYLEDSPRVATPGTLKSIPVKIIDLGSSQAAGTNTGVGIARENWFVMENLRKILKPLFDNNGRVNDWFLLKESKSEGISTYTNQDDEAPANPLKLTGDVFRLLCVLNIFLGHLDNSRDKYTDVPSADLPIDHTDLSILNVLMDGELVDFREEVFGLDILAVLGVVPGPQGPSYVSWRAVIEYWGALHPGFKNYVIHDARIMKKTTKRELAKVYNCDTCDAEFTCPRRC